MYNIGRGVPHHVRILLAVLFLLCAGICTAQEPCTDQEESSQRQLGARTTKTVVVKNWKGLALAVKRAKPDQTLQIRTKKGVRLTADTKITVRTESIYLEGDLDDPLQLDCNGQAGGFIIKSKGVQLRGFAFNGCSDSAILVTWPLKTPGDAAKFKENEAEVVLESNTYNDNSALYDGVKGGAISVMNATVTVLKSNFSGNIAQSGSAIYSRDGTVLVEDCLFANNGWNRALGGAITTWSKKASCQGLPALTINRCMFSENNAQTGGAIACRSSSVILQDCDFNHNSAFNGAAISLDTASILISAKSCLFSNNEAEGNGGAFFITNCPNSFLTNITLMGNQANSNGGAIAVGDSSSVTITNCVMNNNHAKEGGALYLFDKASLSLKTTTIEENESTEGGAIKSTQSSLSVGGCVFNLNSADTGGAIQLTDGSELELGSYLSQNSATKTGGTLYIANSTALLSATLIDQSKAPSCGAIHVVDDASRVTLNGVSVSSCEATKEGGGMCISGKGAEVTLKKGDFSDNKAGGAGGAIAVMNSGKLVVDDTTFVRNSATSGGAVAIMQGIANVSKAHIWNNRAYQDGYICQISNCSTGCGLGGGICVDQPSLVDIDDSDIIGNEGTYGGGGYVAGCDHASGEDNCRAADGQVAFRSSNISYNGAEAGGGGALFTTLDEGVQFECRRDATPTVITYESDNGTHLKSCAEWMGNQGPSQVALPPSKLVVLVSPRDSVASGESINASVRIADKYGEVIIPGSAQQISASVAIASFSEDSTARLIGTTSNVSFAQGQAYFQELRVIAKPGEQFKLKFSAAGIDLPGADVAMSSSQCQLSQIPSEDACTSCLAPWYSFSTTSEMCSDCPDHAWCNGTAVVPATGYWNSNPLCEGIHYCNRQEGCLRDGDDIESLLQNSNDNTTTGNFSVSNYQDQLCKQNYAGYLCRYCSTAPGSRAAQSDGRCVSCGKDYPFIVYIIARVKDLVWLLLTVWLSCQPIWKYEFFMRNSFPSGEITPAARMIEEGQDQPTEQPPQRVFGESEGAYLCWEMMVDYQQMLAILIQSLGRNYWPGWLVLTMNILSFTPLTTTNWGSIDCKLMKYFGGKHFALSRIWVNFLMPAAYLMVVAVFVLVCGSIYRHRRRLSRPYLPSLFLTACAILSYFFPLLCYNAFLLFSYEPISTPDNPSFGSYCSVKGTYWGQYDIRYFDPWHKKYALALGLFILIMVVAAKPIVIFSFLSKRVKMKQTGRLMSSYEIASGQLIGQMKLSCKYWWMVSFLRRMVLCAVVVFLAPITAAIQINTLLGAAVFLYIWGLLAVPFTQSIYNVLQQWQLIAFATSVYLTSWFPMPRVAEREGVRHVLGAFLVLVNAAVIIRLLLTFLRKISGAHGKRLIPSWLDC